MQSWGDSSHGNYCGEQLRSVLSEKRHSLAGLRSHLSVMSHHVESESRFKFSGMKSIQKTQNLLFYLSCLDVFVCVQVGEGFDAYLDCGVLAMC